MFRSDRDALADKVDDLRSDNERLRAENEAMRADLLARRAADPAVSVRGDLYGSDAALTQGERAALRAHTLRPFPVWATVVLHVLTLGLFSFFHFNLLHDRLPKAERDDPSAFKSIALHLVPYFNLYWVFWNGLRLADRVNLQLRLRGEGVGVSRGAVIAAGVLSVIPYVNLLLAPFAWLVVAVAMQRAVNRIANDSEGEDAGEAAHRVRIEAVGDLPGPAEVAAEQAAEDEAAAAEERAPLQRDRS